MPEDTNKPSSTPAESGPASPERIETEEERTAREAQERLEAEQQALEQRAKAAREVARNWLPEEPSQAPSSSAEQPQTSEATPTIPSAEQKPEGWMAKAGDTLKSGAETVTGWMKKFGSWISGNAGKGWKHFVEGATATIAAIGTGLAWLREKTAHAFGSLTASVDDYLPDWLKKPLNFLMGDYGVLYKNLAKRNLALIPNDPKQDLSLESFMGKYKSLAENDKGGSFDDFCKSVALKARNGRTGPLKIKQSELEQAADLVVVEMLKKPAAAPATAPGVVPAAVMAGTAAVAAPSAAPASVPPEQLTRREVQSLTVNGVAISKVEGNGKTLLKVGDRKFSVNVALPVTLKKIEEISDGSIAFTGAIIGIPSTVIISKQEFESIIAALRDATGNKKIKVNYTNSKNEKKEQEVAFEIVTP